jgi:hypothetical protein
MICATSGRKRIVATGTYMHERPNEPFKHLCDLCLANVDRAQYRSDDVLLHLRLRLVNMPTDEPYHAPSCLPCPNCGKLMRLVAIEPSASEQGADEITYKLNVVLVIRKKSTFEKLINREALSKGGTFRRRRALRSLPTQFPRTDQPRARVTCVPEKKRCVRIR